jgi:AraC-like DNA-binding protein
VSLHDWFDEIEWTSYAGGPLIHHPDPTTEIVWRAATGRPTAAFVRGPRTHASYFDGKDIPACLRLRFKPGAAAVFLGVPADRLTDQIRPLNFPEVDDPELFLKHLEARMPAAPDVRPIRRAADRLTAGRSVTDAAEASGFGERRFRDLFTSMVGVSPKQYAGLSRLRTVLDGEGPWATRATDAGYYDQSHMAAHFRALMRITPGAYAAGKLPTTAC